MSTIALIRHSLTDGNTQRLYYGSTDLPLNDRGLKLCEELKGTFSLPESVRFGCTDLLRTRQTLYALFGCEPDAVFPKLRELDMGRAEMCRYEDLREDPDFIAWCEDTEGNTPMPGGSETVNEFRARVSRGLSDVLSAGFYPSLIVCHGGTIAHLMELLFPGEKGFYEWMPTACRGYVLRVGEGRITGYTVL